MGPVSRRTKIRRRTGEVRAKIGQEPELNANIGAREKIVSCDFEQKYIDNPERKTVDWKWTLITEEAQ